MTYKITCSLQLNKLSLLTVKKISIHFRLYNVECISVPSFPLVPQSQGPFECISHHHQQLDIKCHMHTSIAVERQGYHFFWHAIIHKHLCLEIQLQFKYTGQRHFLRKDILLTSTDLQNHLYRAHYINVWKRQDIVYEIATGHVLHLHICFAV